MKEHKKFTLVIDNQKVKNIAGIFLVCILAPACTSYNGLSYVDNKGVAELREQYDLSSKDMDPTDYIPKQFGAIVVNASPSDEDDSPQIFFLKRQKSNYYAQTMLSDNSEDEKAFFKKTYLDFGLNGKNRGLMTKLTMKF